MTHTGHAASRTSAGDGVVGVECDHQRCFVHPVIARNVLRPRSFLQFPQRDRYRGDRRVGSYSAHTTRRDGPSVRDNRATYRGCGCLRTGRGAGFLRGGSRPDQSTGVLCRRRNFGSLFLDGVLVGCFARLLRGLANSSRGALHCLLGFPHRRVRLLFQHFPGSHRKPLPSRVGPSSNPPSGLAPIAPGVEDFLNRWCDRRFSRLTPSV